MYEFNKHNINFPNIENSHVSEATYYRIFAEKFLPKEVTFYTYLDADIICINNPILYLNAIINEMKALREQGIGVFLACRKSSIIYQKAIENKISVFILPFKGNADFLL